MTCAMSPLASSIVPGDPVPLVAEGTRNGIFTTGRGATLRARRQFFAASAFARSRAFRWRTIIWYAK